MVMSRASLPNMRVALAACALLAAPLFVPATASASHAHAGTAALRRTLSALLTDVTSTGSPSACSLATPAGQTFLLETGQGQDFTDPSATDCGTAIPAIVKSYDPPDLDGQPVPASTLNEALAQITKTAAIHVTGNRATIKITSQQALSDIEALGGVGSRQVTGPFVLTSWVKDKSGRWLLNDQPTGDFTPAALKAAGLLTNALKDYAFTATASIGTEAVDFCANGTVNDTYLGNYIPNAGFWRVEGGLSEITYMQGPPLNAQGEPQGAVIAQGAFEADFGIELAGGKIFVYDIGTFSGFGTFTSTPGTAGC